MIMNEYIKALVLSILSIISLIAICLIISCILDYFGLNVPIG